MTHRSPPDNGAEVVDGSGSLSEAMTVTAIRADAETPVTKTNLSQEEIERIDYGQELPSILATTPSITTYADAGIGGSGYSYFRLRGLDQTRINVTFDGIPLNDPEDFGVYFANITNLESLAGGIQIQRGAGTSTNGAPSFAGSVNLSSIALGGTGKVDVSAGAGSFDTRRTTASYADTIGDVSFHAAAAANQSDGFRDNSAADQRSFFLGAGNRTGRFGWKVIALDGSERSMLSFLASEEHALITNPRDNPLLPQERDQFEQNLVALHGFFDGGERWSVSSVLYRNAIKGWYRLRSNAEGSEPPLQFGIDGAANGSMISSEYRGPGLAVTTGFHYSDFERRHYLDQEERRFYENSGHKRELAAFVKAMRTRGDWTFFADAHLRRPSFDYEGDVDQPSMSWSFFNPKVGLRRSISDSVSLYGSIGRTSREPARSDLFQGEDNPSISHGETVIPERVIDFELGIDVTTPAFEAHANLYDMEFRDEIAATGELSAGGLLLRRNVDRSYRRGFELEAVATIAPRIVLRNATSLMRSSIREWTQYYDVYDASGAVIGNEPRTHRDVEPLLSPSAIVNQSIELGFGREHSLRLSGRYVSKAHLDNSGNKRTRTPESTSFDLQLRFAATKRLKIGVFVNNLFDRRSNYEAGYSYLHLLADREEVQSTRYFYPAASRNVVVMVRYDG